MAGSRRDSGSNTALTTRKRRSGGAWADIVTAKRRVAGAWVDVFVALNALVNTQLIMQAEAVSTRAGMQFNADGILYGVRTTADTLAQIHGEWRLAAASADYDIRVTLSSGPTPQIDAGLNVWLNLGTTRTWSVNRTTVGANDTYLLVEIRPAGGGANITSGTVRIYVERT